MVEEATVDCYNEDEQATGLFTMIEEDLEVPFETRVLGVSVTVASVDLTDSNQIVAMCRRDGLRQAIPMLDLPLPTPPTSGRRMDRAYRR
ncbi:MAG: calcium-binding protein [Actinomycetota bacterium]|nr:calcium-binding protein [Actinomycetota bacterium]